MQTYISNHNTWCLKQARLYWCTEVGRAQHALPAHVRQHYCDPDILFDPTPAFCSPNFKRTLMIYDKWGWCEGQMMSWVNGGTVSQALVLGRDFGIARGNEKYAIFAWDLGPEPAMVSIDLLAVKALYHQRTDDFKLLKSQLEHLCLYLLDPKVSNTCGIL